jgi:hypothetical protein
MAKGPKVQSAYLSVNETAAARNLARTKEKIAVASAAVLPSAEHPISGGVRKDRM